MIRRTSRPGAEPGSPREAQPLLHRVHVRHRRRGRGRFRLPDGQGEGLLRAPPVPRSSARGRSATRRPRPISRATRRTTPAREAEAAVPPRRVGEASGSATTVTDSDVAADYTANLDPVQEEARRVQRPPHPLQDRRLFPADAAARAKADAAHEAPPRRRRLRGAREAESEDPGSKASGGDLGTFGRGPDGQGVRACRLRRHAGRASSAR